MSIALLSLRIPVAIAISLRLKLRRQIHPHPPRSQPHPLLLIHIGAGIIPFQKRRVRRLRARVLGELLRFLEAGARNGLCGVAGREELSDSRLQRGRVVQLAPREFAEDGPVDSPGSRGELGCHGCLYVCGSFGVVVVLYFGGGWIRCRIDGLWTRAVEV